MITIKNIYDVFSRRDKIISSIKHDIPSRFRTIVIYWCNETFSQKDSVNSYFRAFWEEIHRFLVYRNGWSKLLEIHHSAADRSINFIFQCSSIEFIDFLEDIFRVECLLRINKTENQMLNELNDLLKYNDIPYFITDSIWEDFQDTLRGRPVTAHRRISYPKVIMRESDIAHEVIIKPTLEFLQRPEFINANKEFSDALEDFRKNDFGDCLTKCNSAFESVMKIICKIKGWKYNEGDTSSKLIKIIISKTKLENYFESVLLIISTLRHRLSTSHGAGEKSREVPVHLARYAINATASAILLLVDETLG